ncbi:MAG: fasciclin domain-containing protein [bacterium]
MKKTILHAVSMLAAVVILLPQSAAAGPKGDTIVDVAIKANGPGGAFEGQLSTLIAALQAADPSVMDALSGNGQLTVFAPTDEAFAALGLDASNVGSAFSTETLTEILLYHVAKGNRNSAAVVGSKQIRTLQGEFINVSGTALTDNVGRSSDIIVTDIAASNGVIHVIDEVILPFTP